MKPHFSDRETPHRAHHRHSSCNPAHSFLKLDRPQKTRDAQAPPFENTSWQARRENIRFDSTPTFSRQQPMSWTFCPTKEPLMFASVASSQIVTSGLTIFSELDKLLHVILVARQSKKAPRI